MISFLTKLPILKRLIPSLMKRLKLKINYKKDGVIYFLDLSYIVDRRFYLNNYENDILNYLKRFVQSYKCDYFLDIGSCWGLYSLQIAKENPQTKVKAFDVYQNNIDRLEKSKKINNINNIECINVAVGAKKKIETFSVNEANSPNFAKDLNGKYKIEVLQDTIDNRLGFENKKVAIKIDVERVELDVLNGAKNLLQNNKCFIIVETHTIETTNYLLSIGYKKLSDNFDPVNLFFSNY